MCFCARRSASTRALNSASDSGVAIMRSGSQTHRPPIVSESDSDSIDDEPPSLAPSMRSPPICSSSAHDTHGSQNRLNHRAASVDVRSRTAFGESCAVAAANVAGVTPQSRCLTRDSMSGCASHPPPCETRGRWSKSMRGGAWCAWTPSSSRVIGRRASWMAPWWCDDPEVAPWKRFASRCRSRCEVTG